ncbi:hypothetical protein C8R47DRAFT_144784 [Mycena vitilis]|nr:hypothetical protein C8R47DRAFT_144784 [Mycena vitilis]
MEFRIPIDCRTWRRHCIHHSRTTWAGAAAMSSLSRRPRLTARRRCRCCRQIQPTDFNDACSKAATSVVRRLRSPRLPPVPVPCSSSSLVLASLRLFLRPSPPGFAPPCTLWIAVQTKGHRNVAQGRLLLNSAPRARYAKLAGTAAPRSDGGTLSACGDVHPGLYLYPSRTDLM